MIRKLLLVTLLICSLFNYFSCTTSNKSSSSQKSKVTQPPPEEEEDTVFTGYKGVLLIVQNYDNFNSDDRLTLRKFKKYYKGEFIMIKSKEMSNYPDPEKYRFWIKPYTVFGGYAYYPGKTMYLNDSEFLMGDRKTNKSVKTKVYKGDGAFTKFPIRLDSLRQAR